jgi:hypothetical protein
MTAWHRLRHLVTDAYFFCAGAVAWVATHDVDAVAAALADATIGAQIVTGPRAGTLVGFTVRNAFEERVRRVLDPQNRFSAASHSDQ